MPRSGCSALHGVNPNLKKKKLTENYILFGLKYRKNIEFETKKPKK